jgi:hypothetical protein
MMAYTLLGSWFATPKASAALVVTPIVAAKRIARMIPRILEKIVPLAMISDERKILMLSPRL